MPHFFRLAITNPLPMLSFLIMRPFPDWCRIGALALNWFNWQGYRHANALPILGNALPIPCQLRTKIQLTEKNQSKTIDFQSLPSEGRCSANPVGIKNLSGAVFGLPMECQLGSNGLPIECQSTDIANWLPMECQFTSNPMSFDCQLDTNWLPIGCQLAVNQMPIATQSDAN